MNVLNDWIQRFNPKPSSPIQCAACGKDAICFNDDSGQPVIFCQHCVEGANRLQSRKRMLLESGVPQEAFSLSPMLPEVLKRALENKSGLYVCGPNGTGKTVFAVHVAVELALRFGKRIKFKRTSTLIIEAQAAYRSEWGQWGYVRDLCGYSVLILDDLGKEKITQDAFNVLFEIISERTAQRDKLITLVTSNYSLDEIDLILDRSLTSRLRQMCPEVVRFDGEDMRFTR